LKSFERNTILLSAVISIWWTGPAAAQRGVGGLEEKSLSELSNPPTSSLAKVALALASSRWKHAETEHFIYHYFNSFVATPVSVEAEFYERVVTEDLGLSTGAKPGAKNQIFLFEEPDLWREFQSKAELDPWSGGIHSDGALFLLRDRAVKFKGTTLGHEIVHALIHRHVGEIPLWLNEGYAEYASNIGYASYMRARDYSAKPRSKAVDPAYYIPVAELVSLTRYPTQTEAVSAFYAESQRLVSFLQKRGKKSFVSFLRASASGEEFEVALSKSYPGMFKSVRDLEAEFRPYATATD